MKWMLSFFVLLLLWVPLESNAGSTDSQPLIITLEKQSQNTLMPGDIFTEVFSVENISSNPVKVRVRQVINEENSKLFSVVQGNWTKTLSSTTLMPLESLITDWFYLDSQETITLPLALYFPASCGNKYQNAILKAKFLFEYQIQANRYPMDETTSQIPIIISRQTTNDVPAIPSTGDSKDSLPFYLTLCIISCLSIIFLDLQKKYPGA